MIIKEFPVVLSFSRSSRNSERIPLVLINAREMCEDDDYDDDDHESHKT